LVALILAAVIIPSLGGNSTLAITLIILGFVVIAALYVLCLIWFLKAYWSPVKTAVLGLFTKFRRGSPT
jgi:CHASE2 domain-containing sensor protein